MIITKNYALFGKLIIQCRFVMFIAVWQYVSNCIWQYFGYKQLCDVPIWAWACYMSSLFALLFGTGLVLMIRLKLVALSTYIKIPWNTTYIKCIGVTKNNRFSKKLFLWFPPGDFFRYMLCFFRSRNNFTCTLFGLLVVRGDPNAAAAVAAARVQLRRVAIRSHLRNVRRRRMHGEGCDGAKERGRRRTAWKNGRGIHCKGNNARGFVAMSENAGKKIDKQYWLLILAPPMTRRPPLPPCIIVAHAIRTACTRRHHVIRYYPSSASLRRRRPFPNPVPTGVAARLRWSLLPEKPNLFGKPAESVTPAIPLSPKNAAAHRRPYMADATPYRAAVMLQLQCVRGNTLMVETFELINWGKT